MLAPSLLSAEEDLARTANDIRSIGGFAESCLSANLAQFDPPLPWVDEVRDLLADCRGCAQRWLDARQMIIPQLSTMFIDYASVVSAAAANVSRAAPASDWTKLLTSMRDAARSNSEKATGIQQIFAASHDNFKDAHQRIKLAVQKAEEAKDAERDEIEQISVKLQALYDRLAGLGAGATGQSMAGGEAIVKTTVKLTYQVMIKADTAVPVLDIVTTVFNISSSVYAVVHDNADIRSLLRQVSDLLAKLAADVRTLAMTRALLIMLDGMNDAYVAAAQIPPRINSYWDAEVDKIGIALQALRSDVSPASMTELAGLPTAATVWLQIAKVAKAMAIPDQQEARVVPFVVSVPAN
jgi:hypothetical protein